MVSKKVIKKANAKAVKPKLTVKLKTTSDLRPSIKISAIVSQMFHNKISVCNKRN